MAGTGGGAFLLRGLVNGYGNIEATLRLPAEVPKGIEARLTRIEKTLGIVEAFGFYAGG